jgi:hypothetical protein
VIGLANELGAKYFDDTEISQERKCGALHAIRELVDAVNEMPEEDLRTDPLTGEKRWP